MSAEGEESSSETESEADAEDEDEGSGRLAWDEWDEEPVGTYITTVSTDEHKRIYSNSI